MLTVAVSEMVVWGRSMCRAPRSLMGDLAYGLSDPVKVSAAIA
jgi:hypothetical protein